MTIDDYLQEYLKKFDTAPPPAVNPVLAPVAQLEACLDKIWVAYRRAKLPLLSIEQRQLMVGNLTPDQVELLLMVVEFLGRRPDLATAWGLPTEAFQEIIDKDAELLRLRACATLVVEASDRTLRQLQATVGALNTKVLLYVEEQGQVLVQQGHRGERDKLVNYFQAAIDFRDKLKLVRAPGAQTPPRQTAASLRADLDESLQDAAVMKAVAAILDAPVVTALPAAAPARKKRPPKTQGALPAGSGTGTVGLPVTQPGATPVPAARAKTKKTIH